MSTFGKIVKRVARVASPVSGALYDAVGGKAPKQIAQNYARDAATRAGVAATALPFAMGGGAASGAVGAGGAATGGAGAARAAGGGGGIGLGQGVSLGAEILGQLLGGIGAARQRKTESREDRRRFDLEHELRKRADAREQSDYDMRTSSLAASAPMREKILNMLQGKYVDNPAPRARPYTPVAQPNPDELLAKIRASLGY